MKRKRVGTFLWLAVAALIIAIALFSTAFRVLLYSLDDARQFLADQIAETLEAQVEIDRAVSEWAGVAPRMIVEGLSVRFPDAEAAHQFDRVSFTLDLLESLRTLSPVLNGITVEGGAVEVQRLTDGRWALEGMVLSEPGSAGGALSEVRLRNVNVVLTDAVRGARLNVGALDADLAQGLFGMSLKARHTTPGPDMGTIDLSLQGTPWGGGGGQLILEEIAVDVIRPWLPEGAGEIADQIPSRTRLSVQASVDWESAQTHSVAARLNLAAPEDATPWNSLGAEFLWKRDAAQHRVALESLSMNERVVLGPSYAEFADGLLSVHTDTLDLKPGLALAEQAGFDLKEHLPIKNVSGMAHQLQGRYDWTGSTWQTWSARFGNIAFVETEGTLKVGHLNGAVTGNADSLQIDLESEGLTFSYTPMNFKNKNLGKVQANMHLQQSSHCCRLYVKDFELNNSAFHVQGAAWIDPDKQGAVDMRIKRIHLPSISQWLPSGLLLPADERWLYQAFLAGEFRDGHVRMQVPLSEQSKTPFALQAVGELDAVDIDYDPSMPPLRELSGRLYLDDLSLHVTGDTARIMKADMSHLSIFLQDLSLMHMHSSAYLNGPLTDIPEFLTHIEYLKNDLSNSVGFKGSGELDLAVSISLDNRLKVPTVVQGDLRMLGNEIVVQASDTRLENVRGTVRYEDAKLSGLLKADFLDAPINIDVTTNRLGELNLQMDVRAAPQVFMPPEMRSELSWIEGNTEWDIELTLPGPEQPSRRRHVSAFVKSNLQGLKIDLPEPLGLPGEAGSLLATLRADWDLAQGMQLTLDYGAKARARLKVEESGVRGVIALGRQEPEELPSHDLIVTGSLPKVNLQDWADWQKRHPFDGESSLSKIYQLNIGELDAMGLHLKQAQVSADFQKAGGTLEIDAPTVRGSLTLPEKSGDPVIGSFEHLEFHTEQIGELREMQEGATDPKSIPSLHLDMASLKWGSYPFQNVSLRTRPNETGMRIEQLHLESQQFHADLSGQWEGPGENEKTTLGGTMHSDDIHETLKNWEIDSSLRNGVGDVSFNMAWDGGPSDYSFKAVQGEAMLNAKDGQIRQMAPEFARVLALLNMEMIFDRLRLDFDDVLRGGFTYETAEGEFTIREGSLYTEGLRIVGSSAQFLIAGRIGVTGEDYELRVVATPEVSVLLPVAAGAVAGPIGVAGAYLGNKLLELFGAGIDDASVVTYDVTGSWENPVIKEVPLEELSQVPEED